MISFLMTTFGRYLIGGSLIILLACGGYLYVSHLQAKVAMLQFQVHALERAKQIYENDKKIDRETGSEKDRIDSLTPGDLDGEWDRLRQRSQGEGGKSSQAGD